MVKGKWTSGKDHLNLNEWIKCYRNDVNARATGNGVEKGARAAGGTLLRRFARSPAQTEPE